MFTPKEMYERADDIRNLFDTGSYEYLLAGNVVQAVGRRTWYAAWMDSMTLVAAVSPDAWNDQIVQAVRNLQRDLFVQSHGGRLPPSIAGSGPH